MQKAESQSLDCNPSKQKGGPAYGGNPPFPIRIYTGWNRRMAFPANNVILVIAENALGIPKNKAYLSLCFLEVR